MKLAYDRPPDVLIAGIDEAGRGPLAGPVYAAAVVLDPAQPIAGLADSKAISPRARETLAVRIREQAMSCWVATASVEEIDDINVLAATLLAMTRAFKGLSISPGLTLVDGNRGPRLECPVRTVVKGDSLVPEIMAASILAKVDRDAEMVRLDAEYPGYGFAAHKGYPTRGHRQALLELGASPVHRRSFAPVRAVLANR